MESSALIPLSAVATFPPSQVGQRALLLGELATAGVPVLETVVIPTDTLHRLAAESHMGETLKKVVARLSPQVREDSRQLKAALIQAITSIELPKWFTTPIVEWYHHQPSYVTVRIGSTGFEQTAHHHVHGETNIIDSIANLWAQEGQINTRTKEFKLFAKPIMLHREVEPTASGVAYTDPLTKTAIKINAVWGIYEPTLLDTKPSEFVVDVRTQQVISRQIEPQYIQLVQASDALKEKPLKHHQHLDSCITDEQLSKLTSLVARVRQVLFDHRTLYWCMANGEFYFTNVDTTQAPTHKIEALLTGQAVIPGIVGGVVGKEILVVPELSPSTTSQLTHVAAVVCDRGIASPHLLQVLKAQNVTTIINTHQATRILKPGQRVLVDGNSGKVLQAPQPLTQESLAMTPLRTATKIFISAGNPTKATEYMSSLVDGVGVLRSEYTFAQFADHPLTVIRSHRKGQLQKALQDTILAYQTSGGNAPVIYRCTNFTSHELRAFGHAESFEPTETNPYLGVRGGLKLLQNQELFDFELETIKSHLQKHTQPLGVMVPFVRSSGELQLIHTHLKNHRLHQFPNYSFWLQLNTPENLVGISHYLTVPIDGFSINVRSIHALLHGIDPDEPELYSLYPLDATLFENLLKPCVAAIKKSPHALRGTKGHPDILLHLEDSSTQLVELAVRLGLTGVTVKPQFVPTAKQRASEVESMIVHQK